MYCDDLMDSLPGRSASDETSCNPWTHSAFNSISLLHELLKGAEHGESLQHAA